jgi:saccharopine dehydrogenase (NAD+, L-lysine-forming)
MGAALAVLRYRGQLEVPLRPYGKQQLDDALARGNGQPDPRVLVIGALGRCGRGARAALSTAGIEPTCWDLTETRDLDRDALLRHDILVNTVLAHEPIPPFLTHADLDRPDRGLSLICDVTCDVTSPCNALPIYERVTSWPEPVVRLRGGDRPVEMIAIDNLPSLLPLEASMAFSAELTPHLLTIEERPATWRRCEEAYREAGQRGTERSYADV